MLKAGVIYGKGDHMLDHLSHALSTFPVFALVGMKDTRVRPLAVGDLTRVIEASLVEGRLSRQTVAAAGPEELEFSEVVRGVARVIGKRAYLIPAPVFLHYFLAWGFERVMTIPLASIAQVRILAQGIVEPLPACDKLPANLPPQKCFNEQQIRQGLPEGTSFGLKDLRWFA